MQITRFFRQGISGFIILIAIFIALPCFAQARYNPLLDDPMEAAVNATTTRSQQSRQNIQQTDEGIQFDPERGIIVPEETAGGPSRRLDIKNRGEDFLYSELERKSTRQLPPEDSDKGYIDRQIDRQFTQMGEYLKEVGEIYKKGFSWILDKVLFVLGIIKGWPFVKNPPPLYLSLPLLGFIYFLICYPLMKIGRTVTGSEWMAWVPVFQLILLLKITERSMWSLLVFIIPVANLFLLAIIFMEICDMFRQPPYFGLAILIPGLNIALLWYLANVEFD